MSRQEVHRPRVENPPEFPEPLIQPLRLVFRTETLAIRRIRDETTVLGETGPGECVPDDEFDVIADTGGLSIPPRLFDHAVIGIPCGKSERRAGELFIPRAT